MHLGNVRPADFEWVEAAVGRCDRTVRWSIDRGLMGPPLVSSLLWEDVPLQQLVRDDVGAPHALLQVVGVDLSNGLAEMAVMIERNSYEACADLTRAVIMRAYFEFPIRTISVSVVAGELDLHRLIGEGARSVATLPDRVRRGASEYADTHVFDIRLADFS